MCLREKVAAGVGVIRGASAGVMQVRESPFVVHDSQRNKYIKSSYNTPAIEFFINIVLFTCIHLNLVCKGIWGKFMSRASDTETPSVRPHLLQHIRSAFPVISHTLSDYKWAKQSQEDNLPLFTAYCPRISTSMRRNTCYPGLVWHVLLRLRGFASAWSRHQLPSFRLNWPHESHNIDSFIIHISF